MFYDPQFMLRLARMLPGPRSAIRRAIDSSPRTTPQARYGRCPICREFVRFQPTVPAGDAPCPGCGYSICTVEPLGPSPGMHPAHPLRSTPGGHPTHLLTALAHRLRRWLRAAAPGRQPPRDSNTTSGVWDSWLDG